jgi:enamidase
VRLPLPHAGLALALALAAGHAPVAAQRGPIGDAIRGFVSVDAPVVALTHARVIDGTGAPARDDQTLVLRDGLIAAIGPAASTAPPAGARVVDLAGKSVMPGLVMLHEHLYYPTGPGVYGQLGQSFVRLYLAGGVTTMRTGGNLNGYMDLTLKRRVEAGEVAGPAIDATMPYVNGPNQFVQMTDVQSEERARRHVAYWADEGATSVKAYMQISRAALGTAIREAHARGLKVTGHLCSVTYAEAAALGIDNLEHGFFAATDFVPDKQPDVCPGQGRGQQTVADLDPKGTAFQTLVRTLVEKKVAVTSTLTVFEAGMPSRPVPPGLDVLLPDLRAQFEQNRARAAANTASVMPRLFPKAQALEREFARAGGLLVAGTDPTGGGGVVPGFSNHRQLELLVEAGFTPLEAIAIGTRNGARYLGQEARIGTLAAGKQADLVVVDGDPSTRIGDLRKVVTVFRRGVGFDPASLIQSVAGKVGLW